MASGQASECGSHVKRCGRAWRIPNSTTRDTHLQSPGRGLWALPGLLDVAPPPRSVAGRQQARQAAQQRKQLWGKVWGSPVQKPGKHLSTGRCPPCGFLKRV